MFRTEAVRLRCLSGTRFGRLVVPLTSGTLEAGSHRLSWDGRISGGGAAPSGIYFVRLASAGQEIVTRLALLR